MTESAGHVLVTGAARRVGRVIALTLAKAGWDVTIHYNTSESEAQTLAHEIEALGRRAFLIQADLEHADSVQRIYAAAKSPYTALVNNASLFEHNEKDPDGSRHRRVNVEAPILLLEAFGKQLPLDVTGGVVHLLDGTPMPDFLGLYARSRIELEALLPEQAKRYAPRLRINAVAPGPTLRGPRESENHFAKLVADTPLKRASTPQDVAEAVRFLLEARSVTGQVLKVDSGIFLTNLSLKP